MRGLSLVVATVACGAAPPPAKPEPPKPIVVFPAPPVFRLDHTFEPTSYRARVALAEPRFTGAIEISGTLAEPTKTIWLHGDGIAITSAYAVHDATKVPLEFLVANHETVIGLQASEPLAAGVWTLMIDYTGGIDLTEPPPLAPRDGRRPTPAPKTFGIFRRRVNGQSYYFTQFESIYARRVFPCIDEPDRKVPWQLTLDIPSDANAYSNTPVTRKTALDAKHERVEFAQTLPLPSYLVAFAIGAFDVVDAGKTRHDVPIRLLTPRGDGKDVTRWAPSVRQILATYEDWFDIPYPYPKLDIVYVPRFGLGGMENAGLITVEQSFGGDLGMGVLAHELAHQWFGDLVTHAWWDDVWLTEKMASWMAARVSISRDAVVDRDLVEQSAQALRDLAYRRKPIRMSIKESRALDAIDEMYDYNGDIFSLFESYLGPDTFRRALHIYLERHANSTATAADFAAAVSEASGQSLDASFLGFVEHTGVPHFGLGLSCASGHRVMVAHLSDAPWPVPMCYAYDHDGKRDQHCESIEPTTTSIELPATRCPKWFLPSVDGVSLAQTAIAQPDLDALLGPGWAQLTPRERRAQFIGLKGELPILAMMRRLVDTGDAEAMQLVARSLTTLYELVPPDLHAKLDAWILRRFEPFRANLHLVVGSEAPAIAELLALAGDPALVAEARAPSSDPRFAGLRLRILTEHDPALTEQLLDKVRRRVSNGDELDAVSRAHTTLSVLQRTPALLHGLHPRTISLLLQTQCDGLHTPAHDAIAGELPDPDAHFQMIWQLCVEHQQRLAPAFAKLVSAP